MSNNKILVFDYDGTIHNTLTIYEKAFRKTYEWLVSEGYVEQEEVTTEQIASWLGLNSKEMWSSFQPDLDPQIREIASRKIGEDMAVEITSHRAFWYPNAADTLSQLKEQGYHMVVLSNCKISYRECHWKEFEMAQWFERFYDCESYGFAPKTEIIQEIKKEYPGEYAVIGDRAHDMACARSCGAPFVGCLYGFCHEGELEGADRLIQDISELPEVLKQLL